MSSVVQVFNLTKTYEIGKTRYLSITESIKNIFKGFNMKNGVINAIDNISFEVDAGEIFGIIGKNGAGKSTLLKMISKITYPTLGEIILDGKVASLIEIDAGFHDELTGYENIFLKGSILGMPRKEIKLKLDQIINFSELEDFADIKLKFYSSGMRVRLGFSIVAFLDADILVVDEVLAVGDFSFREKCIKKIKELSSAGKTILFVSHDLPLVKELCKTGILLEKGKIKYRGNIDDLLSVYLDNSIASEKFYAEGPIQKAKAIFNEYLSLSVIIRDEYKFTIPNLGFVLYNERGFPITGNNLVHSGLESTETNGSFQQIEYTLKDPSLEPGTYFISIWYGSGAADIFNDHLALSFTIEGQKKSWSVQSKINVRFN